MLLLGAKHDQSIADSLVKAPFDALGDHLRLFAGHDHDVGDFWKRLKCNQKFLPFREPLHRLQNLLLSLLELLGSDAKPVTLQSNLAFTKKQHSRRCDEVGNSKQGNGVPDDGFPLGLGLAAGPFNEEEDQGIANDQRRKEPNKTIQLVNKLSWLIDPVPIDQKCQAVETIKQE